MHFEYISVAFWIFLCKINPSTGGKGSQEGLERIARYRRKTTVEVLGARVGKLLAKYKMGKFIHWRVHRDADKKTSNAHRLEYHVDEEKIANEKRFDGCYIVTTDVAPSELHAAEVVAAYRKLTLVEQACRNLKTVQLEVRPVYHKKDDLIRKRMIVSALMSFCACWLTICNGICNSASSRYSSWMERASSGTGAFAP